MTRKYYPHSIKLVALFLGTLLISCSNSTESLSVIPKDANFVSVIDVFSIIKKANFSEISESKFFKTLNKEIRSENKKASKLINDIMDDPTLSGIDFKSDVLIYYINELQDEQYLCISAEISKETAFTNFLEEILEKSNVDFDIEEEKTYKYTVIGNEIAIGWDQKKATIIFPGNYESGKNLDLEIENLMTLKEKDQIKSNSDFVAFYKDKKDISFWLSTNLFEESYDFKQAEKELDIDITDNNISTYLNFEDDHISLLTELAFNNEIQELMEENDLWNSTFNSQLLKLFPDKNYATASVSLNPMAYYKIMEEENDFQEIETSFERETDFELKEMFESIEGNAVLSLIGFDNVEYTYKSYERTYNSKKNRRYNSWTREYYYEGGYEYIDVEKTKEEFMPLIGFAFDINDTKILEEFINNIPEEDIEKRSNYYEFKIDNRYPTYLAYNEKSCFITNDKKSVKSFKEGGYTDHLGNSDISSSISKSSFYTFLNLDYDSYPKDIKKEVKNNLNNNEQRVFKVWNEFAKSIELKQIDNTSFELIFNTKNKGDNSLHTIIKALDDNYKTLVEL